MNQALLHFGGALIRPQAGDRLGTSLAFADPDGDGIDELLAGMPGRDVDGAKDAGAILVLPAHEGDPLVAQAPASVLTRADVDPGAAPRAGERFGEVLLVADVITSLPGEELVLGLPSAAVNGRAGAGEVLVASLPTEDQPPMALRFTAASAGMDGLGAKAGDRLGHAVSVLDLDADGNPELAFGTPGHGADGGAVNVLTGTPTGPVTADSHLLRRGWAPDSGGIREADDRLGWSLR